MSPYPLVLSDSDFIQPPFSLTRQTRRPLLWQLTQVRDSQKRISRKRGVKLTFAGSDCRADRSSRPEIAARRGRLNDRSTMT